jgi:hypothetical protein
MKLIEFSRKIQVTTSAVSFLYTVAPTSLSHFREEILVQHSNNKKGTDINTNCGFDCLTRLVGSTRIRSIKKLAACLEEAWNRLHFISTDNRLKHKATVIVSPEMGLRSW